MPTKTVNKIERKLTVDNWESGPYGPDVYENVIVSQNRIDKPTSTKRRKPSDLFANGTSRTVWSRDSTCQQPCSYQMLKLGSWNYWGYLYTHNPYGDSWSGPATFNGLSRDSCDTKTLLAIKDQKVNLSVSIAELGKTTDMAFDIGREVFQFLRSVRRGDVKGVLRALKHPSTRSDRRLAEQWLRFQYGILPTALEVHGLSEFLYQKVSTGFISGSVSAGQTISGRIPRSSSRGLTLFTDYTSRYVRKNTYRYQVDSQSLRSLSQTGISNPALLAYELVPYSFVLDWFIPIGDYLATLDSLVGIKNLGVIKGDFEFRKEYHLYEANPGGIAANFKPGIAVTRAKRTRRLAPVNTLKPAYPRYEMSLSTKRLVSATALLRNLFK